MSDHSTHVSVAADSSDEATSSIGDESSDHNFDESDDFTSKEDDSTGDEDVPSVFGVDESLNEGLCDGINTSKAEALLTYVMRYSLSSAALVGLLQLINQIFGRDVIYSHQSICCVKFSSTGLHCFHSINFYCIILF